MPRRRVIPKPKPISGSTSGPLAGMKKPRKPPTRPQPLEGRPYLGLKKRKKG